MQEKREVARTIMPTLGEELKRRREERNIALSDISEATRIGIRFLKAIETDSYSVLPGGIFTRSFIRAYAKEVGMSEDEAISLYNQQTAPPAAEPSLSNAKPQSSQPPSVSPTSVSNRASNNRRAPSIVYAPEPESSRPLSVPKTPTRTNWGTILIAAGILIIIGIVVTALVRQLNKAEADKAAQTDNAPAAQQSAPQNQTPTPTQPENPPKASATTDTPPASQAPSVPSGAAIVVKLEALGDAWIKVQVDEGQAAQTILKTGQVYEIPPAQTAVKLNYGNRQTLKLTINNREASFPADAPKFGAQVVISRDNLQTYFQPPPSP